MERWPELLNRSDVQRLRAVVGDRDDAILTFVDEAGRIVWGSAAGSRSLFGREPDEYLGDVLGDYVHPQDRHRVSQAFATAFESDSSERVVYRARAADGSWVAIRVVIWPAESAEGERLAVVIAVPVDRPPVAAPDT